MSFERYQNESYSYDNEYDYEKSSTFSIVGNNVGMVNRRAAFRSSQYSAEQQQAMSQGVQMQPMSFDDYKPTEPGPIDISKLILPPPNMQCYVEPIVPKGKVVYLRHVEPTIQRTVTLNFNTVKTVVRENIVHHQHNKTVITNVNRNHWHTQRIVVKDNNYHHYLINNVVRINDIHHQKVEQVRGEGKSFNDFKQTQRIEAAKCDFTDKDNKTDNFGIKGEQMASSDMEKINESTRRALMQFGLNNGNNSNRIDVGQLETIQSIENEEATINSSELETEDDFSAK